jgi:MarR family transcriptional regulator, organic hydroperoxide resistance regulator
MDETTRANRRLQTQIVLDLQRVRHGADRRVAELLAQEGLTQVTPAQANALMALVNAQKAVTGAELARSLGRSEVTVSRFLKALEAAGWVARERDADDSRRVLVRPTSKTRTALARFVRVSNALLDDAFADLGEDEIVKLGGHIAAVAARLDPA